MNTKLFLKSVIVLLVLSALTVLTGCTDQITSSGNSDYQRNSKSNPRLEDGLPTNKAFQTQIKLRPFTTYTFGANNTPFQTFSSIDVDVILIENDNIIASGCKDIEVYDSLFGNKLLGCHAKGLNSRMITIKNLSSSTMELEVKLLGVEKYLSQSPEVSE